MATIGVEEVIWVGPRWERSYIIIIHEGLVEEVVCRSHELFIKIN